MLIVSFLWGKNKEKHKRQPILAYIYFKMEQTQEEQGRVTFQESLDIAIELGYIPKSNTRLTERQKRILELITLCEKTNQAVNEYKQREKKPAAEYCDLHINKPEEVDTINLSINRIKARKYFFPSIGPYNPRH